MSIFRRHRVRLIERLGYSFTDSVSGEVVYRWRAEDGTEWLANSRRGRSRVKCAGSDPTIGFVEAVMGEVR